MDSIVGPCRWPRYARTSYILSLAVGIPVSGLMADRFGTRRVFTSAVALFTLASVMCGLAVNVPMLVAVVPAAVQPPT